MTSFEENIFFQDEEGLMDSIPLNIEFPKSLSPTVVKANPSTLKGEVPEGVIPLDITPSRSNCGPLDVPSKDPSSAQSSYETGLNSFPHRFILDFLYLNPWPQETRLHYLANLASLLYDTDGSDQEVSVCDERG